MTAPDEFNAFSHWTPKAVRVTRGAENIATFQKSPFSELPARGSN